MSLFLHGLLTIKMSCYHQQLLFKRRALPHVLVEYTVADSLDVVTVTVEKYGGSKIHFYFLLLIRNEIFPEAPFRNKYRYEPQTMSNSLLIAVVITAPIINIIIIFIARITVAC